MIVTCACNAFDANRLAHLRPTATVRLEAAH